MSVYGYGDIGMGYRYPRRARKAYIADKKGWTRAAVFNAVIAKTNPWVNFLRDRGYYNEISKLLQEARDEYYKNPANLRDPERKIDLLTKELEKLSEEQQVINQNYADLLPQYRYSAKLPYDEAVKAALDKLEREKKNIQTRINKIKSVMGAPPLVAKKV
jgi:chromosome segregation ATPase